jgi:hypothetical protein
MGKLLNAFRVYVIGGNSAIERIFQQEGATTVDHLDMADIVVWTGGSDVNPALYGEEKHPSTYFDAKRDLYEQACYNRAGNKLKVGICRGGQFLNVMNGGTLWQDVDGHAIRGEHEMILEIPVQGKLLSRKVGVTSTHHQMMIPNLRAHCHIWGKAGISTRKSTGIRLKDNPQQFVSFTRQHNTAGDAEVIHYPKTRSLCFQPHPEYDSKSTREVFFTCIELTLAI